MDKEQLREQLASVEDSFELYSTLASKFFYRELRGKMITTDQKTVLDWAERRLHPALEKYVQQERLKAKIEMLEATDGVYLRVMLDGGEDGNYPTAEKYLEGLHKQLKEYEKSND